MRNTVRQIKTFVQKIARKAALNAEEAGVVTPNGIVGISQAGRCKVSDISRAQNVVYLGPKISA